jgi:uncharacterized protein
MVTRKQIDEFLMQKRFALIGVSRNSKDYSRSLFRELRRHGYEVMPVNPHTTEIDGLTCYSHVQAIVPLVPAAIIVTPPAATERVIQDCAEAKVSNLWILSSGGRSSLSQTALQTCMENGIKFIDGYCPLMFLTNTEFFHRFHGYVLKFIGKYPR